MQVFQCIREGFAPVCELSIVNAETNEVIYTSTAVDPFALALQELVVSDDEYDDFKEYTTLESRLSIPHTDLAVLGSGSSSQEDCSSFLASSSSSDQSVTSDGQATSEQASKPVSSLNLQAIDSLISSFGVNQLDALLKQVGQLTTRSSCSQSTPN